MATIATGSKTELAYVEEVTYGVTPTTPAFQKVCFEGTTLGITKDTLENTCLTADRQQKELRTGNRQTGGDLNTNLEYGSFDDWIEAVLMGTWTADVLKAGVVSRSFTVEKYFDLDTDEYHRFTGCKFNTWSLNVDPSSLVASNFAVIGKDIDDQNLASQVAGSTYTPALGNPPFDPFTGAIIEGGSAIAVVTSIGLELTNGIEPAFVLMSKTTIEPGEGKSRLTGTLEAFFEDSSLYTKFLSETPSSLVFTFTDPDGAALEFNIPNLKYTAGNPDISGEGNITLPLTFTAIYDSIEDSQIVITRTAAP